MNSRVHCAAARDNDVFEKVRPGTNIVLHDRVVGFLVDASRLHVAHHVGLEESLGTAVISRAVSSATRLQRSTGDFSVQTSEK